LAALGAAPAAPALGRQRRTQHAHTNARQTGHADVSRSACRRRGGGGHHAHAHAKRYCAHETGPLPHELRVLYAPGAAVSAAFPCRRAAAQPAQAATRTRAHTHRPWHDRQVPCGRASWRPPCRKGRRRVPAQQLVQASGQESGLKRGRQPHARTHGAGMQPETNAPASSLSPSAGPPSAPPPWRPAALESEGFPCFSL